jgi:hypothetical protein
MLKKILLETPMKDSISKTHMSSKFAQKIILIITLLKYQNGDYLSKAQWSLYVPPVVTIRTASLTFNNSTFCPHSLFMCFVWI